MFTRERFKRYAEGVRKMSENRLQETGQLPTLIGIWRDDVPYVYISPGPFDPEVDEFGRDPMLRTAWICIRGMEPDEITIAHDSYMVTQMTKSDGTEWGPGDMQYAREHNTVDAQYVFDTVMLTAMDRTGSAAFTQMPYKLEKSALGRHKVQWLDLDEPKVYIEGEDPGRLTGHINDVLRRAFAKPTLHETLEAVGDAPMSAEAQARADALLGELSPEQREQLGDLNAADALAWAREHPKQAFISQMCAIIKAFLAPMGCEVVIAIRDEETLGYVMSSLKVTPGVFGPEDLS